MTASSGHTDVLDFGDLSAARATEKVLPVRVRLMRTLQTLPTSIL